MQKVVFNTSGGGYWSNVRKAVEITDMRLAYVNDEKDFGELRVYFDPSTWNVNERGLIYTDRLFLKELKSALEQQGFDSTSVSYSEQGMQGDNYVSLDVGEKFLRSWSDIVGIKA